MKVYFFNLNPYENFQNGTIEESAFTTPLFCVITPLFRVFPPLRKTVKGVKMQNKGAITQLNE